MTTATNSTFLRRSGLFALGTVLAGQALFAAYIAVTYGKFIVTGDPEAVVTPLQNGIIPGDRAGNALLFLHLALAFVITVGAFIQFVPVIRRRWPVLHRWNGRIYMTTALVISSAAIVLKLSRELHESALMTAGVVLNGVLILAFVFPAWWNARAHHFDAHRRWALRLFVMVSGTFLLRVGLMFWMATTGGAGVDFETFRGPFLDVWYFAHYLIPLALLEGWLRLERKPPSALSRGVAVVIGVYACTLVGGAIVATFGMWLPLARGENIFV